MAFRVCARWLCRDSAVLCRRAAGSAPRESASRFLGAGNAACSRGGRNGFIFTPACFITSEAFLNRLMKGKAAEAEAGGGFYRLPASVPPDSGEQLSLLMRHPDQPDNSKVLKVAIIGAPNAGKSTLSNQLLGRKVFAVSKKVHTTRTRSMGVLTEDDTQIILLDTPGLTTASKVKRHQLEKSLLVDPWNTVKEADLMVVMVDVADRWMCKRLDFEVLKCLAQHPDIPAVLVLNKVDLFGVKDKLLDITAELTCGVVNGRKMRIRPVIKPPWAEKRPERHSEVPLDEDNAWPEGSADPNSPLSKEELKALRSQQGWPHFKDVFMLSSVDPEDVETLKNYFMVAAKPGPWQYHSEVLTDQSPEEVCTNIIREKLLENLPQEVPYSLTQTVEFWQNGENSELEVFVKLYAKKDTHVRMVIGTGGQMVSQLAREAAEDLSRVFLREVKLRLSVKLKK
ncbi:GTPase Era, mitochondrial ERA-like protein 1 Precursor [Larimichthys crocea]|uniref:GTPase Era, mitochondrial n=1 Tax=Larimichthys crocea TaxID=215358 RepID=A0A6G0I9E0_LARCR|nr:GTPase Era, mitochondrial isoform X1 [Larimichthys crocea]KAE8287977.1 GTPase Era, mitochondrial ERA-like protein 1 Precursor [Larimichthys crocea]